MRWSAIHQFVPSFARGDAIGNHVAFIKDHLRSQGCDSEIFVGTNNDETSAETIDLQNIDRYVRSGADTLFLYHVAQASPCAQVLLERTEPLALVFHNFTPPEVLLRWDPSVAFELLRAQDQLADLVERSSFAICDSNFNAQVLSQFGDIDSFVIPLPVDAPAGFESSSGPAPTVLFVGRVAPNKGIHDLITALAVLKQRIPEVKLRIVGASTSDRYDQAIEGLIRNLALSEAITMTGWVDDEQLEREYGQASVFCTLSDHEGFGVPLVEAMARGIPLVSYASTAVGETVGEAGLVLASKTPTVVAGALERVLTDDLLAERLCASGRQRSSTFSSEKIATALNQTLLGHPSS